MKKVCLSIGIGALLVTTPAFAGQLENLDTPYASRGECESANAGFSNEVRDPLLQQFPNFFYNEGDVASFLTRAFTCELSDDDGQWYIHDHRFDVIRSDWYQRRH